MIINSMIIIDANKEEAREFNFSRNVNLMVSQGNTQGKSSVVKSMYYALGYEIKIFPSGWNIEDMYFQLHCEFDGESYIICRRNNVFKVKAKALNQTMGVREFSNWLQDKLNIDMRLPNTRTRELHRAYASAVLLPFYIDQDTSWAGTLYCETATDIKQYGDIPKTIMEYALGLSDVDIQELIDQLNKLKSEIKETKYIINGLDRTIKEYESSIKDVMRVSEIDRDNLKHEIESYLGIINDYNTKITQSKMKILNKQKVLNDQKQELAELNELLKINDKKYKEIRTECSLCHSKLTVEQSLARLQLSNNKLQIEHYKDIVSMEITEIEAEISELLDNNNNLFQEVEEIAERVQQFKKLLTFDEYVDAKSKTLALKSLTKLRNCEQQRQDINEKQKASLEKAIKDKRKTKNKRRARIVEKYNHVLSNVQQTLSQNDISDLSCLEFKKIKGSGIHWNKKYLAYYLVYFTLLKEFSVYKVPICMDSFIKNEISKESLKIMLKAVEDYFFSFDNQSFFSIIEDNIQYLENIDEYNKVYIGDRILSKEKYHAIMQRIDSIEIEQE